MRLGPEQAASLCESCCRLGGLPPTRILTQREADRLAAHFRCLNKPSPAARPLDPSWKTRRFLPQLAFSLAGSLLPLLNRGPMTRVDPDWLRLSELAAGCLLATELLRDLQSTETGAGHPRAVCQSLAPSPGRFYSQKKENAIRSTWNFLEISESNPALTRREKSAHLTGGCVNG